MLLKGGFIEKIRLDVFVVVAVVIVWRKEYEAAAAMTTQTRFWIFKILVLLKPSQFSAKLFLLSKRASSSPHGAVLPSLDAPPTKRH